MLVVNAGSSSLKLRVVVGDKVEETADLGASPSLEAVNGAIGEWDPPDAVGHRVVHGGSLFTEAVLIDESVEASIASLADLAPLHQAISLAAIAQFRRLFPHAPHIACFDTAFHSTIPEPAATYALPLAWRERWNLKRFGFHGLSHSYVARRCAELLQGNELRIVSCHLGAGASLAAIRGGVSLDTTMGFTPLEGLIMATRSGSFDPAIVLWLQEKGLDPNEIGDELERGSGLLGLAGRADMEEIVAAADAGEPRATLALGAYVHRLRQGVASMAVSLDGLDVLAFTGGVGERSARVRTMAATNLGFLGIAVDAEANEAASGDSTIDPEGASVRVLVLEAHEELQIAGEVEALLNA